MKSKDWPDYSETLEVLWITTHFRYNEDYEVTITMATLPIPLWNTNMPCVQ